MDNDFKELNKYSLTEEDWAVLEDYEKILEVIQWLFIWMTY